MGSRTRSFVAFALFAVAGGCAVQAASPAMAPAAPGAAVAPAGTMEPETNRNGSDYYDFAMDEARPELCRDACFGDARCAAFTYVNPGVQGPEARCWLKKPAPEPQHDACCVSGVNPGFSPAAVAPVADGMELRTDRIGGDFDNFELKDARPELCRDACRKDARCVSFTYVAPKVKENQPAHCWLKGTAPPPVHAPSCVSGMK